MTKEELIEKLANEVHDAGFKCMILIEDGRNCVTHICHGIDEMAIVALSRHYNQQQDDHRRQEMLN